MTKILNDLEARTLTILAAGSILTFLAFFAGMLVYQSGVETANSDNQRTALIEAGWTPANPLDVIGILGLISLAALIILVPKRLETPEENAMRHAIRKAKIDAKIAKRLDDLQQTSP